MILTIQFAESEIKKNFYTYSVVHLIDFIGKPFFFVKLVDQTLFRFITLTNTFESARLIKKTRFLFSRYSYLRTFNNSR